MRQIFFVLGATADDVTLLNRQLKDAGFERIDSAVESVASSAAGPSGIRNFESLNRDLLRVFDYDAGFAGPIDFSTLPPALEEALVGPLREHLRGMTSDEPLVCCSAELTATLPFWLEAFPSTAAVLAFRSPAAQAVQDSARPGEVGGPADPKTPWRFRIEKFLSCCARTPSYLIELDGTEAQLQDRFIRLAQWIRTTVPLALPPPSPDRRPWQIRLQPEPTISPLISLEGVSDEDLHLRMQAVSLGSDLGHLAASTEEPLVFRWRTVLREAASLEWQVDLDAAFRRDMEEKEEQLLLLKGEVKRLKDLVWKTGKDLRRYLRHEDIYLARMDLEIHWRQRLQASRIFRFLVKALRQRLLLKDPMKMNLTLGANRLSPVDGGREWLVGDPRRQEGLRILRKARGRRDRGSNLAEEHVRFAPLAEEANEWLGREAALTFRPKISVIMPVHNIDPGMLRSAIQSVVDQAYPAWELCIALDEAVSGPAREVAESFRREWDGQIILTNVEGTPGIAVSTNAAARHATGEFVVFLDHDDRLSLDALLRIVEEVNAKPEADVIYSDEDKIEENGTRGGPFFKPDYSPDLLLSFNYITHLLLIRRSLFEDIGGVREGFDGSQDFDLVLRATERARSVAHIRQILYHWRRHPGSTALDRTAKGGLWRETSRRALQDAVERRGWQATVSDGLAVDTYRVRFEVDPASRVTVIVPTSNNFIGLEKCVQSVLKKTRHPSFEILIVSNNSNRPEMLELLDRLAAQNRVRVLRHDVPFNFSAINNFAVKHCETPYLLMLNDDTEALHPEWMTALLEHAQRPDVGAVGAQLIYPSRLVQHAGIYIHPGFLPDHAFKLLDENDPGYYNLNRAVRNSVGVTAACLMVRRSTYLEVGGLDESLAVTFNDVDFCFKLLKAGYRNVYTPFARLFHYESISRGVDHSAEKNSRLWSELDELKKRWGNDFDPDPYYNIHLEHFRNPTLLRTP